MRSWIRLVLLGALVSGSGWAKHWHEEGRGRDGDDCYFQQRDVRVIHEYYAPQYRSLPPGLEKKLYRTGHLPPGWEKKIRPLPVEVERELVPVPPDYRRGIIDGYAVIYSPRTQVVIDIVGVFGSR